MLSTQEDRKLLRITNMISIINNLNATHKDLFARWRHNQSDFVFWLNTKTSSLATQSDFSTSLSTQEDFSTSLATQQCCLHKNSLAKH